MTSSRRPADLTGLPPVYPILDVDLCSLRGRDPIALAQACVAGGARLLQVRQKGTAGGSGALLTLTREIIGLVRPAGVRVLVNDRADIAAMAGADGVHVGQQDLPVHAVRSIVGPNAVVGVSTHTPEQIDEAAMLPIDYLAVGPVFTTTTKDTGYEPRGLELVRYAAAAGKPIVAIGGITAQNAAAVLEAGASFVAVISYLLTGEPEARVREFIDHRLR